MNKKTNAILRILGWGAATGGLWAGCYYVGDKLGSAIWDLFFGDKDE